MADPAVASRRRRARRHQQRRAAVAVLALAAVLVGAGTAWAMARSSAPVYRLAKAVRANVAQTISADGTIATVHEADLSFATSGTVAGLRVATGDSVRAGQVVARLDPSELQAEVVKAQQTLATAKQKLADDESAQTSTTMTSSVSTSSSSSTHSTDAESTVRLAAATSTGSGGAPGAGGSGSTGSTGDLVAGVVRAQGVVVRLTKALDAAIANEDAAIDAAVTACAETDDTSAVTIAVTADSNGAVTGSVATEAMTVTLLDTDGHADTATTSTNPQTVAANAGYAFAGLTAGGAYQLQTVRSGKVISTADCTAALADVQTERSKVDDAAALVDPAVSSLSKAITALQEGNSSGGSTPSGTPSSSAPSGSQPTGSRPSGNQPSGNQPSRSRPSGSQPSGAQPSGNASSNGATTQGNGATSNASSSGTATAVTAQQLVADQKAIDAARAQVQVAKSNRGLAVLRTPISGTVAAVSISKGDSATTSTSAVTIVGKGRKSVAVNVSLADVDLVHVGERASVTVDGLITPLAARVTQVGLTNTASSTGSASTYAVTVVLDKTTARLYDGMGATVAVDVGSARNVLTVPTSAVTTSGSLSTVRVYSKGKVTATRVTLGVQGADRVQVKSGLSAGEQVVLAEISAAIPSSDSTQRRFGGTGSSLTSGLTSGSGGGFGGPPPGR